MKILIRLILLTLALLALTGEATALATSAEINAANNVYVSNVTYDPGSFFTGDAGTVTVAVTNGNANQSIVANHATFGFDNNFQLTSGSYDTSSTVGPLQTRTYTFSVITQSADGSYYPTFSLNIGDATSIYYRGLVKVDNTPIVATLIDKPDAFTPATKNTLSLQLANPREDDVKNVIVDVDGGSGADILPATQYIGVLSSGASTVVNFTVTPNVETTLNVTVKYDNGDNHHSVDLKIPVAFTTDKMQADPVMSNIVIALTNGTCDVTGDITNAGLSNANGVTVTSLSPAIPQEPDRNYVIGTLKPDDFGSFEITFTVPDGTTSVPLQLSYKDSDGNILSSVQNIDLTQTTAQPNSQPSMLPVLVVVIIAVIFVGGWYVYLRRHKE
ncbi:conserved hypothetical protein [Methanoregula boonei 6A8]|uniref:CARDB domain-containing protein n=1 Tax=Methanoregula boonei (strain DSM 21154 / JCM 14090 / 6A8) TaxID=456442 RepID=A7I4C4_METB6|nr:hypothetical protein [Methanoregula boonei]ABS54585.1 conserved hypothetical protein [Methanoregula boonei 6A8]